MRDDLTIVVSPLVSLMQDQVGALERVAPGRVGLINAQHGPERQCGGPAARPGRRAAAAVRGARAVRLARLSRLRWPPVGSVCSSSTRRTASRSGATTSGPDYFTLADAATAVGARATLALTATATPTVADDIVRRLHLRDPVRITTGFDRPNLSFVVVPCRGGVDKERRLAAALGEPDALPAIVYAGTRGASEELAGALRATWASRCSPTTRAWTGAAAPRPRTGSCPVRCG